MNTLTMFRPAIRARAFALAAALLVPASAFAADSVRSSLTLRSFTDFGHLVRGTNNFAPEGYPTRISMQPLNRASFVAIQEVAAGNFDVSAGLAAMLWWPYGGTSITDADERSMQGRASIPVARARWRFGDPASTAASLQVGTFSHKYNPDAKNLGEYLYRSGTYPGYIWTTEGWLFMSRASQLAHGAMLTVDQFGGALRHNLSLLMQTTYFPVGDFSPGYDVSFRSKWFEVGGGAVLSNYLSLRPSRLNRKDDPENTLIRKPTGTDSLGDTTWYVGPAEPVDLGDPNVRVLHHWTHKGVKLMGRGAINLGHLLPQGIRNPEDGRVFAEVAVLGWKDQPLYYEDRMERMPVMFGVNLPTFKMLDVLTVQGEYYRSPFNDIDRYNSASLPIWEANLQRDPDTFEYRLDAEGRVIPTAVHDDDWKWSVYARKSVNRLLTVHAQAASDHFRLMSGPRYISVSRVPLTSTPSEWYYLIRFEFAMR